MNKATRSRKEIKRGFVALLDGQIKSRHITKENAIQIVRAYNYADETHKKEMRDDNSRYIEHCLAVALILLIECKITILDFIIVALLHDVPETINFENPSLEEKSFAYIARKFGIINSFRVRTITKLKVSFVRKNYSKILVHFADIVSIFVKLADTLHNIRTLKGTSRGRQRRKALFVKKELPLLMKTLFVKIDNEIKNKKAKEKLLNAAYFLNKEIKRHIKPYNYLLIRR